MADWGFGNAPGDGAGASTTDINESAARLFVPPTYLTSGGTPTSVALTSATHGDEVVFRAEADFALSSLSHNIGAVTSGGDMGVALYELDGTAYERNGLYNPSLTNVLPSTMTANNAPIPWVVGLYDSAGANAEAVGYEAYKALDGSVAAGNGMRSNAAPTSGAPQYITIDAGEGNTLRTNLFEFVAFNDASADIRAFPYVHDSDCFWASDGAAPAPNNDGDWTALTRVGPVAVDDPGAAGIRRIAVLNAAGYRHLRIKIKNRTGTNAYFALAEIRAYAAQLVASGGTLVATLGPVTVSGAGWLRHTFTAQQLQRGKSYAIRRTGAAGANWTLGYNHCNTSAESMPPEELVGRYTIDGFTGVTWPYRVTDGVYQRQLFPMVVLNPTTHHVPKLGLGRHTGQSLYLPTGTVTIPQEGVFLDCESLTAGTEYCLYAFNSSGTLTLEASTTQPTAASGLLVKSGETSKRFLGRVTPRARISTYVAPVDCPDGREVCQPGVEKLFYRDCPYLAATLWTIPGIQSWFAIAANDDYMLRFTGPAQGRVSFLGSTPYGSVGFMFDGVVMASSDACHSSSGTSSPVAMTGDAMFTSRPGAHTLHPAVWTTASAQQLSLSRDSSVSHARSGTVGVIRFLEG